MYGGAIIRLELDIYFLNDNTFAMKHCIDYVSMQRTLTPEIWDWEDVNVSMLESHIPMFVGHSEEN
jgi:hypothetical protein